MSSPSEVSAGTVPNINRTMLVEITVADEGGQPVGWVISHSSHASIARTTRVVYHDGQGEVTWHADAEESRWMTWSEV